MSRDDEFKLSKWVISLIDNGTLGAIAARASAAWGLSRSNTQRGCLGILFDACDAAGGFAAMCRALGVQP